MLVPGSNELRFANARSSASCTRSSARSTFPHNEMAKARKLGTAASITSRMFLFGLILRALVVARVIEVKQGVPERFVDILRGLDDPSDDEGSKNEPK